jgi:hypothetical protein
MTRTKVTNKKIVLDLKLGDDVGFRNINNYFYDTQRSVPKDESYDKLTGKKIDKKC